MEGDLGGEGGRGGGKMVLVGDPRGVRVSSAGTLGGVLPLGEVLVPLLCGWHGIYMGSLFQVISLCRNVCVCVT